MNLSRSGSGLPLDSPPCVDSRLYFCLSHSLRLSNLRSWFSGVSRCPQIKSVSVLCLPLWFLLPLYFCLANPFGGFISSMINNMFKCFFQHKFFSTELCTACGSWERLRCFESWPTTLETYGHWLSDWLIDWLINCHFSKFMAWGLIVALEVFSDCF